MSIWTPPAHPNAVDPLEFDWSGVAAHGNTPFDCKLVTEIEPGFFLGGCMDGFRLPEQVEHVVSLYPWERYWTPPNCELRGEVYLRLYDSVDQDPDAFHFAADVTARFLDAGPTLLHCQAGLNRSGTVAALVLMRRHPGMTAYEALSFLRAQRTPAVVCNPAFERWLLGQERQCETQSCDAPGCSCPSEPVSDAGRSPH